MNLQRFRCAAKWPGPHGRSEHPTSDTKFVLEKVPRRDGLGVELRLLRLLSEIRAALHTKRPVPFYRVPTVLLCNRCNRTCYVTVIEQMAGSRGQLRTKL